MKFVRSRRTHPGILISIIMKDPPGQLDRCRRGVLSVPLQRRRGGGRVHGQLESESSSTEGFERLPIVHVLLNDASVCIVQSSREGI